MARRTIFDQLKSRVSYYEEIHRLEGLLHDENGIRIEINDQLLIPSIDKPEIMYVSIEKFVDTYRFKTWKQRGTCVSCSDMRRSLNINKTLAKSRPNQDEVFTYIEYVYNILVLCKSVKLKDGCEYYETDVFRAAAENVNILVGKLNCEFKAFVDEQCVKIFERDATITAVAEIVEPSLSYKVISYNHYTLKGDIAKKKAILLALGAELEPNRKQLSAISKQLTECIFFLFNNIDIRHNNKNASDKNYRELVCKMPDKILEKWYDELYQMCLLALLELDQVLRYDKVEALKREITAGEKQDV